MASTESRVFLLRQGVSQRGIARALALHECTISLLLSGTIHIDARLDQIAVYLGITRRQLDNLIHSKPKKKAA